MPSPPAPPLHSLGRELCCLMSCRQGMTRKLGIVPRPRGGNDNGVTSSKRLTSYRLFVEQLLELDQHAIRVVIASPRIGQLYPSRARNLVWKVTAGGTKGGKHAGTEKRGLVWNSSNDKNLCREKGWYSCAGILVKGK